jgi:hypothetical protein
MATILWLDGFEHGRAAALPTVYDTTVGSVSAQTTPVRTGVRSMGVAAGGAAASVRYNIAAGNRIITMSFYIRFAALPTADVMLAFTTNSSSNGQLMFINATDQFGVKQGGNAAVAGGPTIVVDTWYRVVWEVDSSASPFVIRCRVDGGTEFSTSFAATAADAMVVALGTLNADTFTAYYDDWIISQTDGDYEDIGGWTSHEIESLVAASDGTHNIAVSGDFDSFVGTAFANGTTTGWTFIDHRPLLAANVADDVIRQKLGAVTNYMEFLLENHTLSGTPLDARAYATHVEAASAGASLAEARLLYLTSTEIVTTGSLSVIDTVEDPGLTVTIRKRMCIRPAGGWDNTKVDDLKARVGFGDNAPDVNFIDFMVEVLYFTAGGAAPKSLPPRRQDRSPHFAWGA